MKGRVQGWCKVGSTWMRIDSTCLDNDYSTACVREKAKKSLALPTSQNLTKHEKLFKKSLVRMRTFYHSLYKLRKKIKIAQ